MKRYNLQHIHYNSLFSLNLLSLPHSEYRYTQTQYNSLIYSEGLPSRAKNPKFYITSTIRSPPNKKPRLTTKLQHFTMQFYIYFLLWGHCPLSPTRVGSQRSQLPPLQCIFYEKIFHPITNQGPMDDTFEYKI